MAIATNAELNKPNLTPNTKDLIKLSINYHGGQHRHQVFTRLIRIIMHTTLKLSKTSNLEAIISTKLGTSLTLFHQI